MIKHLVGDNIASLHLPWYHRYVETDKGADTQRGDGGNSNFDESSKRHSESRMYGVHPSNRPSNIDKEADIR